MREIKVPAQLARHRLRNETPDMYTMSIAMRRKTNEIKRCNGLAAPIINKRTLEITPPIN